MWLGFCTQEELASLEGSLELYFFLKSHLTWAQFMVHVSYTNAWMNRNKGGNRAFLLLLMLLLVWFLRAAPGTEKDDFRFRTW